MTVSSSFIDAHPSLLLANTLKFDFLLLYAIAWFRP